MTLIRIDDCGAMGDKATIDRGGRMLEAERLHEMIQLTRNQAKTDSCAEAH